MTQNYAIKSISTGDLLRTGRCPEEEIDKVHLEDDERLIPIEADQIVLSIVDGAPSYSLIEGTEE